MEIECRYKNSKEIEEFDYKPAIAKNYLRNSPPQNSRMHIILKYTQENSLTYTIFNAIKQASINVIAGHPKKYIFLLH